jgi:hypothetical protein
MRNLLFLERPFVNGPMNFNEKKKNLICNTYLVGQQTPLPMKGLISLLQQILKNLELQFTTITCSLDMPLKNNQGDIWQV